MPCGATHGADCPLPRSGSPGTPCRKGKLTLSKPQLLRELSSTATSPASALNVRALKRTLRSVRSGASG
eukprot:3515070-Prorocentrum_lima.AAC.1